MPIILHMIAYKFLVITTTFKTEITQVTVQGVIHPLEMRVSQPALTCFSWFRSI